MLDLRGVTLVFSILTHNLVLGRGYLKPEIYPLYLYNKRYEYRVCCHCFLNHSACNLVLFLGVLWSDPIQDEIEVMDDTTSKFFDLLPSHFHLHRIEDGSCFHASSINVDGEMPITPLPHPSHAVAWYTFRTKRALSGQPSLQSDGLLYGSPLAGHNLQRWIWRIDYRR